MFLPWQDFLLHPKQKSDYYFFFHEGSVMFSF